MENRNRKIFLGVAVLLALTVIGVAVIKSVSGQSNNREKTRAVALEEVSQIPNESMIVVNSDPVSQPPLTILSADGKAIDGADYHRLTGVKAEASRYVTMPNIKLVNSSDQTITRFAICMRSKLVDDIHCLRFLSVKIAPNTEFQVTSKDWVGPRAKTQVKFAEKDGAFVRENRTLDLDSEAMWLPGGVQDYTIGVSSAEFESGTKWTTKR